MNRSLPHEINPYIRVGMHSVLGAGLKIARRAIFDYELIYIEKGDIAFSYDGTEYICREGDFIFIHPGVSHSFDCRFGDVSQPHIHFDAVYTPQSYKIPISYKDICDFSRDELSKIQDDIISGEHKSPIIKFRENERVLELFFSIITLYTQGELLLSKAKLTELIYLIAKDNFEGCLSSGEERSYTVAEHIKAYIDSDQGFDMSLDDFEKHFSYSKYHLEKLFTERYGESLISYRNKRRMNLARQLLSDHSVSEVTELLGFSSIYVFSRAFKHRFGISPQGYKESKKK